jgi:hypothetical protein
MYQLESVYVALFSHLSSYELPHRVHLAKVYPFKDPSGLTAVVYGHETGLTVVWKGQEGLHSKEEYVPLKFSGASGAEEQDSQQEGLQAHESIVFHLDVHMSTPVLDLCFPPVSLSEDCTPHILCDYVTVVAACSDMRVRVVRIPLRPERVSQPETVWDELTVATISLTGIPHCVAATWTPSLDPFGEPGWEDVHAEDISLPQAPMPTNFDLLLAACTQEAGGKLSITRIPLEFQAGNYFPFQNQYLRTPAHKLLFNTSTYPSEGHSDLLISHLTSASVYAPLMQSGFWLACLSTPFATSKNMDISAPILTQRKRILDAQWVSAGQNIFVLLADGEWGIWDFAGPPPSQTSSSKSSFSLHGYVGSNASSSTQEAESGSKGPRRSCLSLAPMIHNTRLKKEEQPFLGDEETVVKIQPRGGISLHQKVPVLGEDIEESITLWYNNQIYAIPSLRRFWKHVVEAAGQNGEPLLQPKLSCVDGVDLFGETMTSVAQQPDSSNLVITAEHKLLFLSNEVSFAAAMARPISKIPPLNFSLPGSGNTGDQALLKQGALDLNGLDRLLNDMLGTEKTPSVRNGGDFISTHTPV